MTRNVLITAGSGHIGSELIPLLLRLDATRIILPTSNAARMEDKFSKQDHFNTENCVIEEGSVKDPAWFQGLLTRYEVDAVFFCLSGDDELFTTMNCFDGMARSGTVKHLIYLSAAANFNTPEGARFVLQNSSAAHVLVKILAEQKLQYGGLPFSWTVLRPTLFFTNDLRSKRAMLENNFFDEPLSEKGQSRVAPSDIALAVKNIVVDSTGKWAGKHVCIGSLKAYKGSEIASIWSKALGKDIRAHGTDEDSMQHFEDSFRALAGPAWARDLRLMYELFGKQGFSISDEDYRLQVELLGKAPEDYEAWVSKTAATWS